MIGFDMTTTTQWIGPNENLQMGDVGFLIEFSNPQNGGYTRWDLRDIPAYTNQSCRPLLEGWCGSYNNLATFAHGMGKVIRIAKNGRCLVKSLDGDELQAALDNLGYPGLT